jgi:hypothetical protein
MTLEQIQELSRLRSLNLSPKQIARNLKLRPAEVTEVIRQQAASLALVRAERGESTPLYNCLVNFSIAKILATDAPKFTGDLNGFAQIFVARIDRQKLVVCSYLVDYWCLGVKDALALTPIEFGKDGKPYYINGPHDQPDQIIATLNQQFKFLLLRL